MDNLIDRFEAARILGITPWSVQRLARKGRIPFVVTPHAGKGGPTTRLYPRDEIQEISDGLNRPIRVDDAFANWFAGLVDGEGSFLLQVRRGIHGWSYDHTLKISLRDDDLPTLLLILGTLGIGRLRSVNARETERGKMKGQFAWAIHSSIACMKMIVLLDQHPLRSKKRRDYLTWREFIIERQKKAPNHKLMVSLSRKLIRDRRYRSPRMSDIAKANEMTGRTEFHLRKFVR